jgi:CheY-like chemotaxis protein
MTCTFRLQRKIGRGDHTPCDGYCLPFIEIGVKILPDGSILLLGREKQGKGLCMGCKKESILVVDDDLSVLMVLEMELKDHFEVTPVSSVGQALAHLQCKDFAAIISDVRMPDMNGLSLIDQCAVRYPDMVRIILTALESDDVKEKALGPHGAYKLGKPWGSDLLITLQNALNQRRSKLDLKRRLDLKPDLLDLDRRLFSALNINDLVGLAASEMIRVPEVIAAAAYIFDKSGKPIFYEIAKAATGKEIPELRWARTGPVAYRGQYLYSVPIGQWPKPWAAVALLLSNSGGDTVRYLDFVGRQAYLVLLQIHPDMRPLTPADSPFEAREQGGYHVVSADWMMEKLTTPATVLTSANHSLKRLGKELKELCGQDEGINRAIEELAELNQDLSDIDRNIKAVIDRLKKAIIP